MLITTGDRPSPRYKHQAFIDGDSMYVVGGGSFEPEGPHLDVYCLHLAGAKALEWERIKPIGEPPRCRAAHGLAWDRVGRAAYIWGGFTSGMELDCTFHALRLPLPSSISQAAPSSDARASSSPILASHNRSFITSGLGAAASDDSSAYADADADAVLADIITSETAVLGAGIGEGLGGATSGTTETAEQRQHQVQQGYQPLAQWDFELRPARVSGRDFWRRRGPCLWRQGTREEAGASGPTVTSQRSRDDDSIMRPWGQGWTTDRLQGLWGGGSPPLSSTPPSPADAHADAHAESLEVVDLASTSVHDSGAPVMLGTNCSAAERALRASKAAVDEDLMRWVSLPGRSSLGDDADSSPSPAGRSFHCVVFHGGSFYVTGGSDGDRKFRDMWRFSARESPPPLTTLAARALFLNLATVGDGSGGRSDLLMGLPEGVPTELREALANLNMQAEVVL